MEISFQCSVQEIFVPGKLEWSDKWWDDPRTGSFLGNVWADAKFSVLYHAQEDVHRTLLQRHCRFAVAGSGFRTVLWALATNQSSHSHIQSTLIYAAWCNAYLHCFQLHQGFWSRHCIALQQQNLGVVVVQEKNQRFHLWRAHMFLVGIPGLALTIIAIVPRLTRIPRCSRCVMHGQRKPRTMPRDPFKKNWSASCSLGSSWKGHHGHRCSPT